ncbi:dynein heavy chain, N-terminal region 1-domain-containing protein [Pisolithus sp. B1]|nr:dynein heavy chain, N-terminal region 1-domain-containing protein [Pisolithus sp. B1]
MFKSYLLSLLPPILGTSSEELFSLFDNEFEERVTWFTADGGGMIYIVKIKEIQKVRLPKDLHLPGHLRHCGRALDPLAPLATQLHILNLFSGEEMPYESLHAVMSCGVKPWFDVFATPKWVCKTCSNPFHYSNHGSGIPMTKKKFTELELSLLHLQQNVEIPETHLIIHPIIQQAVEQSIQAVTKLSRDVSSGTPLQEINSGLAQLRSEEVNMVMELHKYNQLMKDFPLNELLSATDLDKIQELLVLIFGHINCKLKLPIKVVPAHAKLQEQVHYLRDWRKQHKQLAVMTGATKGLMTLAKEVRGMDMEEEVKEAYEVIKCIDVLDVLVEGMEIWVAAENTYSEQAARVENQIIAWLHDRLGMARNTNEMFRVFSKFNALFVWPKIHGAIQEYQMQLIDSVKEDIKRLHGKFKTQYCFSEAYHMSQMCDLLPIAVEDVLGKGWELYAEGQKLQSKSAAFHKKLDRDMAVDGCLFEIVRLHRGGFQLVVNFNPQTIMLFKEVQNLLWLGFQWLVAEYRNNAQQMVAKGMNICWDCFVNHYDTAHFDKTDNVTSLYQDILHAAKDLLTCTYTSETFSELLSKIQAAIDRLNLEGHTDTNLEHWVAELDK